MAEVAGSEYPPNGQGRGRAAAGGPGPWRETGAQATRAPLSSMGSPASFSAAPWRSRATSVRSAMT